MPETTGGAENIIKPEIVKLGQRFKLFKPGIVFPTSKNRLSYDQPMVELKLDEGIPLIPIEVTLNQSEMTEVIPLLSPLTRDGYLITDDDFDADKRFKKVSTYRFPRFNPKNFFDAKFESSELDVDIFDRDKIDLLKQLRLQISTPNGSYLSKPSNEHMDNHRALYFINFYPSDTGPLPYPARDEPAIASNSVFLHRGYWIRFPKNDPNLFRLEGRLILERKQGYSDDKPL